jgi:hypothetical protein
MPKGEKVSESSTIRVISERIDERKALFVAVNRIVLFMLRGDATPYRQSTFL